MMARNTLTLLVIAACSGRSAAPPAPPKPTPSGSATAPGSGSAPGSAVAPANEPEPQGTKITLAEAGLEASSLDRTADPCVDFYQFACGGWLATNQIPADRARWGRLAEIDEKNRVAIASVLEEAAKGIGGDTATKKLGDFYASCMDEAAIERAGTTPLKPLLDKMTKIVNSKTWLAAVIELHKLGEWVVWDSFVGPDYKSSMKNVLVLESSGLGLPDRDYYVKPDLKDKLDAYRVHVGKILALAGTPAAKVEAATSDVLAIETELAKLTKTAVEKRDVPASYNPTDPKALAKSVKSVDWKAYWKALGFDPGKKIVVGTPKYFKELDKLRTRVKPAQWASYFAYHLVQGMAFALPKAFDDEAFELDKLVSGVEQQKPRGKRCVDATEGALGELLGEQYVAKHFPPASKQAATTMFEAIVRVMGEELGKLDWMSEATRKTSQQKLAKVVPMLGYPEKWKSYDFELKRDDFAGNVLRAGRFETRRGLQKAGKPVDRSEWQMQTFTVNAYYEPTMNNTALPAGILQRPFFGADRGIAANCGGIGMVIGHELTHGFDDRGAQFDADGNLANWWQKDDEAKFKEKGTCVADQYGTFEASRGQFVNGRLTLGENIADLGGVKMAFRAYRELRKDAPQPHIADGFTEDQQFFLGAAQAWCSKDRPAEVQRRLTVDPHSPPKFRVYGALRNMREFAEAFHCAAGTPMRPANACTVW